MTDDKPDDLFGALVMDDAGKFRVFLINDSERTYTRILIQNGSFATIEDKLYAGEEQTKKPAGDLTPRSFILIDSGGIDELDFVIWYSVEFTDKNGAVSRYQLRLPKYGVGYEKTSSLLPVLNEIGMLIYLIPEQSV